jgi:putative DNA modification/repair radical SAM protein
MDLARKLAILADAAKYDASCASSGTERRDSRTGGLGSTEGSGICHAYAPEGRCISLLKILLTNACLFDCAYCINRASSNVPRTRFTAEEVVGLTLSFYRANMIEGLFLSSGIIRSPDYTMEQIVRVARLLREEHGFIGYIHLKAIPDCDPALVEQAGRYADRLSLNVEMPTADGLARVAPEKDRARIEQAMGWLARRIAEAKEPGRRARPPRFAPGGQSTQMIIGADASDDATVLTSALALYRRYGLRRVYYSAYSPIPHASSLLPPAPPPLLREHRLYQADWLLRFYGFSAEEILAGGDGRMLDLAADPKLAWALKHRGFFPLDINRAPREALLRVPGLGVRSVDRILAARRHARLRLPDLARFGVSVAKAAPFLTGAGLERASLRDALLPRSRFAQPQRQPTLPFHV